MDTKNVIAAISLSAAVIILYSIFFAPAVVDQKDIPNDKDFYFVHSYEFFCDNSKNIIGTSFYGKNFTSFINFENI